MSRLVIGLKTDSKVVEGGSCVRGSDGKLCFSVKERGNVWKDHMEMIMDEENDWDHNMEGDAVEGPVVCVCREEVLQALNETKTGKVPEPSEVLLELIVASGGVGIQVMAEICHKVLRGLGMPAEWILSVVVPINNGKGDMWNCSCYGDAKHLEHEIKVLEMVLDKGLLGIVTVVEMQFGFMPERGTIDASFVLRRQQEEYHGKGKKLYMFFGYLEKAFDRVQRSVVMDIKEERITRCFG